MTDGLPIIPPTPARLDKMLTYCPFDAEQVLAEEIRPSGKNITVRDVAMCAVMAGCKPQYMPVLVAAFKAMADSKYNFLQSVTTSHPGGNLVLVSGPLARNWAFTAAPAASAPVNGGAKTGRRGGAKAGQWREDAPTCKGARSGPFACRRQKLFGS